MNLEALAEQVRTARRDLDRAKILYANKAGTYENMAAAARILSDAMFQYQQAKYPQMKAKRVPYQAILR